MPLALAARITSLGGDLECCRIDSAASHIVISVARIVTSLPSIGPWMLSSAKENNKCNKIYIAPAQRIQLQRLARSKFAITPGSEQDDLGNCFFGR